MALSMDKECLFSGLPMGTCSHCRHDEDLTINEQDDFEITAVFDSQYNGRCAVDDEHKVRRGDRVGFIQRADNPMLPVKGVACAACVRSLPRARK